MGRVFVTVIPLTLMASPTRIGSGGSGVSVSTLLRNSCVNPPLNFRFVIKSGCMTVSVPPVGVIPIAGAALEFEIPQRFPPPETVIPNPGVIVISPVPAGACIVSALQLVLVVKPVSSILLGSCDVPSRDTARGCNVHEISLPIIEMFLACCECAI